MVRKGQKDSGQKDGAEGQADIWNAKSGGRVLTQGRKGAQAQVGRWAAILNLTGAPENQMEPRNNINGWSKVRFPNLGFQRYGRLR